MRAIVRSIVGQVGNLRRIGNSPGPVSGNCRGRLPIRLPIGRRFPTCPTILVCLTLSSLIAETHDEIVDGVSNLANALSTVNAAKFMDVIDKSMPDYDKLKSDMGRSDIDEALKRTNALARALEIRGTPAFVIGDKLLPGAVDVATLKKSVAEARKE